MYDWGGNGKEKGQKGLESICYFNIQISKERYPLLPSLIPWKTDVPKFDACTQCEYSVRFPWFMILLTLIYNSGIYKHSLPDFKILKNC